MKSYIQGMITGGVLVFATIVFMGSSRHIGESGTFLPYDKHKILDTRNGAIYNSVVLVSREGWHMWEDRGFNIKESQDYISKSFSNGNDISTIPMEEYLKK